MVNPVPPVLPDTNKLDVATQRFLFILSHVTTYFTLLISVSGEHPKLSTFILPVRFVSDETFNTPTEIVDVLKLLTGLLLPLGSNACIVLRFEYTKFELASYNSALISNNSFG